MFACKCNVTLYDNFLSREKSSKIEKKKSYYYFLAVFHIDSLFVQRLKTDKQIYVAPFGNSLVLNSGSLLT